MPASREKHHEDSHERSTSSRRRPSSAFQELEFALQDLKSLRPLLLDAADYAEASYLRSDRKELEIGNVRDYAVSMLVNLVDRLGGVADKLVDATARQVAETESIEVHVASLSQRVQACWEYSGRDGLNRQQQSKAAVRHLKRYTPEAPEGAAEVMEFPRDRPTFLREAFDLGPMDPLSSDSEEETPRPFSRHAALYSGPASPSRRSSASYPGPNRVPSQAVSESGYEDEGPLADDSTRGALPRGLPRGVSPHWLKVPFPGTSPGGETSWQAWSNGRPPTFKGRTGRTLPPLEVGPAASLEAGSPSGSDGAPADPEDLRPGGSPGKKKKRLLGGLFGRRKGKSPF